ncbi:hypothetical protein N7540_011022 [Penicillium herquei]|nr:hypothetical protein N7540_011022 [Penicillium herquei]
MQDFYRPLKFKVADSPLPKILGLTASIDVSKIKYVFSRQTAQRSSLTVSEGPREEFGLNMSVAFSPATPSLPPVHSKWLDRTVLGFRSERFDGEDSIKNTTIKISNKAEVIWHQLGLWALAYLLQALSNSTKSSPRQEASSLEIPRFECPEFLSSSEGLDGSKVVHLGATDSVSDKVHQLVLFLQRQWHDEFSGIVFVRERVTCHILSVLLNSHPNTRDRFRCTACVGSSSGFEFWKGGKAQVIEQSEDGLEKEGIDFPACHLVVSFDTIDNVISFIQRRGRARKNASVFALMEQTGNQGLSSNASQWTLWERKMNTSSITLNVNIGDSEMMYSATVSSMGS